MFLVKKCLLSREDLTASLRMTNDLHQRCRSNYYSLTCTTSYEPNIAWGTAIQVIAGDYFAMTVWYTPWLLAMVYTVYQTYPGSWISDLLHGHARMNMHACCPINDDKQTKLVGKYSATICFLLVCWFFSFKPTSAYKNFGPWVCYRPSFNNCLSARKLYTLCKQQGSRRKQTIKNKIYRKLNSI